MRQAITEASLTLGGTMRTRTSRRLAASALIGMALTLGTHAALADSATSLHSLFQDHAVLQRDRPIKVWGRAAPGEALTVSLATATVAARADTSGRWSATLPAMHAGGPYSLSVKSGAGVQQVNDVLVGDVWLCSGQSNMVLQVHRALDARAEIAGSANDSIRMLTVPLANSAKPLEQFQDAVQWQVAAPATVPEFSATCFYFARELQKTTGVPMGLVNASWGGSKIEAWMSEDGIRAVGHDNAALDVLDQYSKDPDAGAARWGAMWETWWRSRPAARNQRDPWSTVIAEGEWRTAPAQLGHWEKWGVGELENYNGMVWYRTTVTLTEQQAKQRALLSIGLVDEVDLTWVNGRTVGNTSGFGGDSHADSNLEANRGRPGPERRYYLPAGTLRAGQNVIAVNVLDTYGNGGLHGTPDKRSLQLADGTVLPLDGAWRYQIAPRDIGIPPRAPWEAVAGLTTIHNAMIAPLGSFGFRGVVWYQGESNTDEADRYSSLLKGLFADWRGKYGADLPFLIVQLANYGPAPVAPVESGWAELREAQRLVVANDSNAGMAVAIDIGDRYDIHPANKQEVGRRLARAARRVVLGEKIAPSGPVPAVARHEGGKVVVTFGDVTDRLVAYSADSPIGFELCGAAPGSCRYAGATLERDRVTLQSVDVPSPTRVRYCWADSPVCTLYDESKLPAGPFQLAIEPL